MKLTKNDGLHTRGWRCEESGRDVEIRVTKEIDGDNICLCFTPHVDGEQAAPEQWHTVIAGSLMDPAGLELPSGARGGLDEFVDEISEACAKGCLQHCDGMAAIADVPTHDKPNRRSAFYREVVKIDADTGEEISRKVWPVLPGAEPERIGGNIE